MVRWRPIESAPTDGRIVLVRCGELPESWHLVSYVDGAWMEIHGGYVLTERETGLPTHWSPLVPAPRREDRGYSDTAAKRRLLKAAVVLLLVGLSLLTGVAIANCFDLLPNG